MLELATPLGEAQGWPGLLPGITGLMSHYEAMSKVEMVNEDITYQKLVTERASRLLRGGSFSYRPSFVRSAQRNGGAPAYRFDTVGFRPARTLPLDTFTPLPLKTSE